MEIFFCDLCNESVPLSDLDQGLAFRRGERVVCATCDRAMSGEIDVGAPTPARGDRGGGGGSSSQRQSPSAQAAPSGGGSGTLLALVALLFAAGGFALLIDRIDRVRERSERTQLDLELASARLDNRYDKLSSGIAEQLLVTEERIHAKRDAGRVALEGDLATVRGGVEQHASRFDELEADISGMRLAGVKGEAERKARVDRLADQIILVEKDLRFYNDRLIELQENMRGIMAGGPIPIAGARPGATPGAQEGTPAWTGMLADLKHKNSGIRLDTLYALAETRDPRVIPHIVPMLDDSDLFVRMGTARILQDLDAREAVQSLIAALEDPESAVRESAMVALRAITGRDFRFEPVASKAERTKRVKAWRNWWKKSGADFLEASG